MEIMSATDQLLAIKYLCPLRGLEGKDLGDCTEKIAEFYETSELQERYHLLYLTEVERVMTSREREANFLESDWGQIQRETECLFSRL